jgi:hypothetical protein
MSDSINTVVSDSDINLPVASAEVKTPGRRGRKPSLEVAARRIETMRLVTDELVFNPNEAFTVSQIVRKLEASGYTTKTLWTDVYTFLNTCDMGFTSTGGTGTRVKWSWVPPVTETESEV